MLSFLNISYSFFFFWIQNQIADREHLITRVTVADSRLEDELATARMEIAAAQARVASLQVQVEQSEASAAKARQALAKGGAAATAAAVASAQSSATKKSPTKKEGKRMLRSLASRYKKDKHFQKFGMNLTKVFFFNLNSFLLFSKT